MNALLMNFLLPVEIGKGYKKQEFAEVVAVPQALVQKNGDSRSLQ